MSASPPAPAPRSSPAGDKSGPARPPSAGSGTTAVEPVQPSTFPAADADALDTLPESEKPQPLPTLDVEHLSVENDPREWSNGRKNAVLAVIAYAAMGGTITANIFLPAIELVQEDLHTTNDLIAATVSIFIVFQGWTPLLWSSFSEIFGRKKCYLASNALYLAGTIALSRCDSIGLFIGMRILQAIGSSAVLALGAGTLSDMYDAHERGTKLGIYYAVPLLGPSIGPILGGALSESAAGWRATFYFLIGFGASCLLLMIWLPETFRQERSMAWRLARDKALAHAKHDEEKRSRPSSLSDQGKPAAAPAVRGSQPMGKVLTASGEEIKVKVGLKDVNPLSATGVVLRQPQNALAVLFSGCLFAVQYALAFTATRSFEGPPWNYGALITGCILLSFGVGNFLGSIVGGRYSDHVFNTLKAQRGGKGTPEMRILSTRVAMYFVPPLLIAYGWVVQKQVHIAAPVVILCPLGAAIIWIYSSTLAYLVDGNPGRSSTAVACNSFARGTLAAVASQASEPLIGKIGNGWFYTGLAVILIAGSMSLLVASWRGERWREEHVEWERRQEEKRKAAQ